MGKTVSPHAKQKGETVYYCPRSSHTFSLPKVGSDGKPVQLCNTATGIPLTDARGNPVFAEDTYKFEGHQSRLIEDGYWCKFIVKKDTPKQVAEYLEKCAKERGSEIITEADFIKATNPDLAVRLEQDSEKDSTIEKQNAEIEELRAKLAGKGQK